MNGIIDPEKTAEEIVNNLEMNLANFEERTLAKQIIQDKLEELEAEHDADLEAMEAEIDMYRGPDGWIWG